MASEAIIGARSCPDNGAARFRVHAETVDGKALLASAGNSSTSSAMVRIPVAAQARRHGSNLLELQIAPSLDTAYPARAGILNTHLVCEASDDEDLCLASPAPSSHPANPLSC